MLTFRLLIFQTTAYIIHMKKTIFVIGLLLTLSSPAQQVGLKTGLVMSRYNVVLHQRPNPTATLENVTSDFKPGLVLGSFVDLTLNRNLFIRSGIELVVKGGVEKGTYYDFIGGYSGPYTESKNFVAFDVPLLLLYKTGISGEKRWLLGGGLVPGLFIEGMLDKADVGAAIVTGYEFSERFGFTVTYNHGLKNVVNYPFSFSSIKNRSAAIAATYAFRQKTAIEKQQIQIAKKAPAMVQHSVQAVYAEIGAPGGFLSFNYDSRFGKSHKGPGLRAGFGLMLDLSDIGFTVPIALNYLVGEKTHFFEAGAGATYFQIEQSGSDSWFQFGKDKFLAPFVSAGYRYQPLYKKFMFRAAVTQFLGIRTPGIFRVPALSFGYRF